MSKTISARIDDTMHTMITDEANHEGITVNEKLKEMLNGHFNGEEKKEIPQSHNVHLVKKSVWEKTMLENLKNQENKVEDICKSLPKVIDLISQTEANILERVNQRMNEHVSKYKHMTKCIGFNNNSS